MTAVMAVCDLGHGQGEEPGAANPAVMWTDAERQTLTAAADRVLPPDDDSPGAGGGAPEFFAALFATDRAADLDVLRTFLSAGAPTEHPFFRTFAEIVHEHYWTSPAGLAAVGFTLTD